MESCLDSLWELVREPVSQSITKIADQRIDDETLMKKRYSAAKNSSSLIRTFFENLSSQDGRGEEEKFPIPKHVSVFKKALDDFGDKSVAGIIEGAGAAKKFCL